MEVVLKELGELIVYTGNARTHSLEQLDQIRASIHEFGFTNPILVDENNVIIAGHGRLEAARSLNLERVPCIELNHLTPPQKKAYILADNKIALGAGWDYEILGGELDALKAEDYDLSLTGFSDEELCPEKYEAELSPSPKAEKVCKHCGKPI